MVKQTPGTKHALVVWYIRDGRRYLYSTLQYISTATPAIRRIEDALTTVPHGPPYPQNKPFDGMSVGYIP